MFTHNNIDMNISTIVHSFSGFGYPFGIGLDGFFFKITTVTVILVLCNDDEIIGGHQQYCTCTAVDL